MKLSNFACFFEELLEKGYNATIVDNLSNGDIKNINPKAKFFQIDILGNLDRVFKKENFDAVIHNAALIDANESISKPELYEKVNFEGTINLLEHCKKFNVKKFNEIELPKNFIKLLH